MKSRLFFVSVLCFVIGSMFAAPAMEMGNAPRAKKGVEIEVYPSYDMTGVIDADNIENALKSIGPRGEVKLKDGHYYVSREISVESFRGTLKGDGMNTTIVEAVRKSEAPGDGFASVGFRYTLFCFIDSQNLTVTDLTLQVTHPNPCDPYDPGGIGGTEEYTALEELIVDRAGANTFIENVRFKGMNNGDLYSMNLACGVFAWGYKNEFTKRNFAIENCELEYSMWGICAENFYDGSTIRIGGDTSQKKKKTKKITMKDHIRAVHVVEVHNSSTTVSNVDIDSSYGWQLLMIQTCIGGLTSITDNTISGYATQGGIYVVVKSQDCTVSGNIIENFTVESPARGAIFLGGSKNNKIYGNTLRNVNSKAGIYLAAKSSAAPPTTGNIIQDNDFTESSLPGWAFGSGCVYLNKYTHGNTVDESLFPPGTTLFDQVKDDGENTVVGWD